MTIRDECFRYIRHGVNNGGKDDWRTPFQLLKELDNEFDFTVDAAADADNAVCDRYWDADADALKQTWKGERVFCNPPFSMTADFLAKAGEADLSIFVIAARTQATYFLSGVFANPHCEVVN
ncbi:MAG: DNA N-6-adenine-methyltransferase [Pantoea sp.]|nr:DNA N-6-adenine-methyltransferase [Pantoea sp.]